MVIPERKFDAGSSYRYGFQGQEQDNEIKGEGNSINYTYRVYDPRLGRFLSRDPLIEKYPFYSPYHFSSNQPIHAKELEGMESEFDLNLPTLPEDIDVNHWTQDPTHRNPGSTKWKDVNGNSLYFDKAKVDKNGNLMPGFQGKDHYHFEDQEGNRYNAAGEIVKSKKAKETHLMPGTKTSIKIKVSVVTTQVNGVSGTTTKTAPTTKTTTQKINGSLKSVFIIADVATTVTGLATGNPDAMVNLFGGATIGELKTGTLDPYEMGIFSGGFEIRENANYFMITSQVTKEWTENGMKYRTVTQYLQHYEGKQKVKGKYVGQGEVGPTFQQTRTYKDGKLINKGKLSSPKETL